MGTAGRLQQHRRDTLRRGPGEAAGCRSVPACLSVSPHKEGWGLERWLRRLLVFAGVRKISWSTRGLCHVGPCRSLGTC